MTRELRDYFKVLEINKSDFYFLFWRFYINPKKFLKEDLSNNGLSLNTKWLYFFKLCLDDDKFVSNLDDDAMKQIRYLLFDLQTIYNDSILSDINKKNLKKENVSKAYLNELVGKINYKSKDLSLIDFLIRKVTFLEEEYCERVILPEIERKVILKKIVEDDYYNVLDCFLFERHGKDFVSVRNLVCDNEFLNVVDNYLLDSDLPIVIIENIIEILQIGVDFKTANVKHYFTAFQMLDANKVKNYSYKRAMEIINLLEIKKRDKKNGKVVLFNERKRIRGHF